jgi:predicted DNA-binding protein (MmcQ/YjbR family)
MQYQWIDQSYDLIFSGLSKKMQKEIKLQQKSG